MGFKLITSTLSYIFVLNLIFGVLNVLLWALLVNYVILGVGSPYFIMFSCLESFFVNLLGNVFTVF